RCLAVMRTLDPRRRLGRMMDCRAVSDRGRGRVRGDEEILVPEMPARFFLSSGNLMADRRFEFARDLQWKGDLPAAADLLMQAIELAPDFTSAWFTLAGIREELGEHDAAIAAFQKAQASDAN